ncbi:TIGR00730 family Rossman fold protein [Actinoplanes sp. LDG1-06]|uniref:Cytokinin riboside 5'-monophosphate phosphoribohydrolase n=1 Tax=Paractinoplanes ovalisporus TaxID=2810368 RepID=A0ABS2AKK2_9ACTN|nr:TIGR00730 family Rossman fold protein [Actinoplanes ovalisporus]MBM2620364.1 TIGR00730 family Rossman fold protein [Actinoplanes ovalisporus]
MPERPTTSIAVFCGARPGVGRRYLDEAYTFGEALGRAGAALVYGAGEVGVMGAVAAGARAAGAPVTGVIPALLYERERPDLHTGEVVVVETMHDRKAAMYDLADGFAILPGGLGTLDELMEVLTWNQLGIHRKPVVLVDGGGFFQPLVLLLDHLLAEGFISPVDRAMVEVTTDPGDAVARLLGAGDPLALTTVAGSV